MGDLINRQNLLELIDWYDHQYSEIESYLDIIRQDIKSLPSAESEIIRCKDCKHKPHIEGEFESGFDIEFPDGNCPCQCEDGWYNWIPEDDWFCANAERKEQ